MRCPPPSRKIPGISRNIPEYHWYTRSSYQKCIGIHVLRLGIRVLRLGIRVLRLVIRVFGLGIRVLCGEQLVGVAGGFINWLQQFVDAQIPDGISTTYPPVQN